MAQTLDKSSYCAGRAFWTVRGSSSLNQLDYCAANHRGIGELRHLGEVISVADAETHGNRQRSPSPDAVDQGGCIAGEALLRAGDAGAGDGVNKTP